MSGDRPDSALDFLSAGGATGALLHALDWTKSPLGHPRSWPQSLRSVVGLLLHSKFPMFLAWGPELGFLYNDPYAEILGAKHPAAMGSRFHDIWSEIWPDISPLIAAALAGEATYREDLPLTMNRKGYDERTWFTFSYSPVRDESGKVAGMFCAVSETTQKVLAEQRLRELNETLERRVAAALAERRVLAEIVENTDAFVQVADHNFRWLAINRAAAGEFHRIFGIWPKVGDSMLDLLADKPAEQAAVRAVWQRAIDGEEFTEIGEFGDQARDRRAYEMKFNTLRDSAGRGVGAYQYVIDVTDRLRDQERLRVAEDSLRQAQKMDSLGQLTGGVAHDFNNLLAVIASGLSLLDRHKDPQKRQEIADGMRHAVDRGTSLTRHLLAFSRRRPMNPEVVDPARQIRGMSDMLNRSLRGDVTVTMDLPDELWPVEIDTGEFELALLNLCVNARDAMSAGGTIAITGVNVPADDGTGALVRLSVTDTGTGMPADVIARAFEPFFTTKEVGKGSGLGLAQVLGFANQSRGRAEIDSVVGAGTTVSLWLPRARRKADAAAATAAPAAALPQDARDTAVLLVEDDPWVAAFTREMLASSGFKVTHVSTAAAALTALADGRDFDVVFSDIMMPGGMSGLELARDLRRRHPGIRIVLTTGHAGAAGSAASEGIRVILKPYHLDSLKQVLHS